MILSKIVHTNKERSVKNLTLFRLGYVAMSVHVKNSSPSQTMTLKQFQQFEREAAIAKLERIANSNIENCLRLLKHNKALDVHFFRLSSRLVPLADHDELEGWNYLAAIKDSLKELGTFAKQENMRIGFHPDHFVVLNSPKTEVLKTSIRTLIYHYRMLKAMGINTDHRCVVHVGGTYKEKEAALERFITNWGAVPVKLQRMILLENDDKSFNLEDTLYLCEKLAVPCVFDYHHHLANHEKKDWADDWERVVQTWANSKLPVKVHLSSPKNEEQFRHHADYIDPKMLMDFIKVVHGTVDQVDIMLESKQKDESLFRLMKHLNEQPDIEPIDQSSFRLKS